MRAFSLVELSIVLVILGLLTGGILAGQSLIRAAELRSVVSGHQRYGTAVRAFQERYMALPGDMPDATSFWGIAGGTTGNDDACYSVESSGKATCNGNGSGLLLYTDNVSDESGPEWYRAWQHLANAGLVEGRYTGKADAAPRGATPGKNVPAANISNVGFTLISIRAASSSTSWWAGEYTGFMAGASRGHLETGGSFLTPEEAWSIDTKIDDGKPAYGLVRDYKSWSGCHNGTDPATAQYTVASPETACSLFMGIAHPGS